MLQFSLPEAKVPSSPQTGPGSLEYQFLELPSSVASVKQFTESEYKNFGDKYSNTITQTEFKILSEDNIDIDRLAVDVIGLAERIVTPVVIFPILPFTRGYREILRSWAEICKALGFELIGTEEVETTERIIPRIMDGIRHSAFLIADITDPRSNVYYEIGYAQGLGKNVILTARTGTKLPFDLTDVPVIFWQTPEELEKKLRKRVQGVLRILGRPVSIRSTRQQ